MQVTKIKVKTRALSRTMWEQVPARYGLECFLEMGTDGNLKLRHSFPDGSNIKGKVRDKKGSWWLLVEYHEQLFRAPYHVQRGIPANILWDWEAQQGITQIYV